MLHADILEVGARPIRSWKEVFPLTYFTWLVVEPTHLQNMRKSNWIISPGIRAENEKMFKTNT